MTKNPGTARQHWTHAIVVSAAAKGETIAVTLACGHILHRPCNAHFDMLAFYQSRIGMRMICIACPLQGEGV